MPRKTVPILLRTEQTKIKNPTPVLMLKKFVSRVIAFDLFKTTIAKTNKKIT